MPLGDLHGFTGPGITTHPRGFLPHGEGAELHNLDGLALQQGFLERIKNSINHLAGAPL